MAEHIFFVSGVLARSSQDSRDRAVRHSSAEPDARRRGEQQSHGWHAAPAGANRPRAACSAGPAMMPSGMQPCRMRPRHRNDEGMMAVAETNVSQTCEPSPGLHRRPHVGQVSAVRLNFSPQCARSLRSTAKGQLVARLCSRRDRASTLSELLSRTKRPASLALSPCAAPPTGTLSLGFGQVETTCLCSATHRS